MKKLFSVLLVLAMMLSLFACSTKPCEVHTDENGDGICDDCEAQMPCTAHTDADSNGACDKCSAAISCEHKDDNKDNKCDGCGAAMDSAVVNAALALSKTVLAQLEAAASFKMDFDINVLMDSQQWFYDVDGYVSEDTYVDAKIAGILTVAKTANGVDMVMSAKIAVKADAEGEYEEMFDGDLLYIIDGAAYTYNFTLEGYTKVPATDAFEELEQMLGTLTEGLVVTDEDKNAVLEALGNAVMEGFSVKDGKGEVKVDFIESIEEVLAYLAALEEDDIVSDVLDHYLATIDPELTVDVLISQLEATLEMTVSEALAAIDAFLTENYGTTLQGIYDGIVNDANFATILENIIAIGAENSLPGEDIPTASELLEELKAFNIAQTVEDAEMGDIVLYDLIVMMMETEEIPTLDELVEVVEGMLSMTLGEFDAMMEVPYFSMMKALAEGVTIDRADVSVSLTFKDTFMIDTLDVATGYDITLCVPVTDELVNTQRVAISFTYKVRDISTQTVSVSLPENAFVVYESFFEEDCFYADEDCEDTYCDAYFYWFFDEDDEIVYNFELYLDDGCYIVAKGIDPSVMSDTTVRFEAADLLFSDGTLTGADLVVVFDLEAETFHVSSVPTIAQ